MGSSAKFIVGGAKHHNRYRHARFGGIDLFHAATILFQKIKKLCSCTGSLVLTARLAVQIQSSFVLLGQNGCRVTKVYCIIKRWRHGGILIHQIGDVTYQYEAEFCFKLGRVIGIANVGRGLLKLIGNIPLPTGVSFRSAASVISM